jgi:hypothetical protein
MLTVITQIGGVLLIISLLSAKYIKFTIKYKSFVVFLITYFLATFLIVPLLAPLFGREKVIFSDKVKPTNYMTIFLNRNYVRPKLNKLLLQVSNDLENTAIQINYLDANFPFINKFPLLPHLSHNDGKKIDISLVYQTENGKISKKQRSRSGYGVFVVPRKEEYNQIKTCLNKGYFQYDYPKYLTLGKINRNLVFSKKGTKILIKSILKQKELGKLFIEPHLKTRMSLQHKKIRYHGCRAVRHDDHIHIQLK